MGGVRDGGQCGEGEGHSVTYRESEAEGEGWGQRVLWTKRDMQSDM